MRTGRTIRGLRADYAMTQREAAEKLGIGYPSYNMLEQGLDDGDLLESIGKLFGVNIELSITECDG